MMGGPTLELSVVAPCYNEQDNVAALADEVLGVFDRRGIAGELILVDDASRDETAARIGALSHAHPDRVRALFHPHNRGIEGGWRTGVTAARGRYVVLIDADLQHPPQEIWRLYRRLRTSRADLVQGVRSHIGRLRDARYVQSCILNLLLNLLFGMHARDNKSGFVIAERATLLDILDHRFNYRYWQTFITVAARAKGYVIHEIETLFVDRRAGTSFIPRYPLALLSWLMVDLIKAVVEYRFVAADGDPVLRRHLANHPPERSPEELTGWRRWLRTLYFRTMPLHAWMVTANVRRLYAMLQASQWQSPAAVRALQEAKMRRMIRHIYHQVPFYRERMQAAGLTPEDFAKLEDLAKLPLLSKADVRENLHFDLFADDHDKSRMLKVSTSGSTGEPFVTYADRYQLEVRFATTLRALEWTGWRFGDRQARLWHQTLGMTWLQAMRERLDALLLRRLFIPAFEMRDDNLARAIGRIRAHRPVLVDGYAESFDFLARYAECNGIQGFRPKAIMTSGQVMPGQTRQAIQECFGARTFDKYGAREFSGIAYECEHGNGHHVMAESYIVELLKDGLPARPGETGEVVVTDLNNFSVPLIRYRIGDLAQAVDDGSPCPCGRGLPRIGRIEGRSQAIVLGSNGTWLPGTFFAHFFKDYSHLIRQYQLVQYMRCAVTLRIVKAPHFTEAAMKGLLTELARYWGDDMAVEVVYVDDIPLLRTGKRTSVIQQLPFDFQAMGVRQTDIAETAEV